MRKVSIENGNYLNVKVDGNKELPAIIFSNSLGTDMRMWDYSNRRFNQINFVIIRYDTRGHGKSSPVEGPYSF